MWLTVARTIHDYDVDDKTKKTSTTNCALLFRLDSPSSLSCIGNRGCRRPLVCFYLLLIFSSIIIFIITVGPRDIYYRLRQIRYCTHEVHVAVAVIQTRPAAAERAEVEICRVRVWRRVDACDLETDQSLEYCTQTNTNTHETRILREEKRRFRVFIYFLFVCGIENALRL